MQPREKAAALGDRFHMAGKNTSLVNQSRFSEAVVTSTILDWKGEETVFGAKLEVTDENKIRIAAADVEEENNGSGIESESLFSRIIRMAREKEAIELKNS